MKYVISLGGSIITTELINELKKLKTKHELVLVCGGGPLARDYINKGRELGVKPMRLDEIGIKATELNAELVSAALGVRRATSLKEALKNDKIIVTNGLFPGITSDFDSVVIAGLTKAKAVINLSNVKGVYDKDPNKNNNAQLRKKMTYDELIKLASEYELGLGEHFIFDLAASKLAKRNKTQLIFTQGVKNLKAVLNGKRFKGTIIK